MSRTIQVTTITFLFFGIHYTLDSLWFHDLRAWLNNEIHQIGISHFLAYSLMGLPIFIGTQLIQPRWSITQNLGFNKSFWKGMVFAIIVTLPMFIGFAFAFEFNPDISINTVLISLISAALFEELYFRGFLFGQLFRHSKLGFIPAVFLGALLFGLIHLYQSNELGELIGIFLVTFFGAILFAWVYVEWGFNIWVPIFLHLFMNFSWELFSVSDNAFGNTYSNIFRLVTIALTILLTILYKKRKNEKLAVNTSSIWWKPVDNLL